MRNWGGDWLICWIQEICMGNTLSEHAMYGHAEFFSIIAMSPESRDGVSLAYPLAALRL